MAMARAREKDIFLLIKLYSPSRGYARLSSAKVEGTKQKKPKTTAPNIAERCKSLLALNWRGQLTTIKPRLVDREEEKKAGRTLGEYTNYTMLDGEPVIWVPDSSQHCPNLLLNNRASLIVGHTDPPPLMKAFQQASKVPPHAVVVGTLIVPEDGDDMVTSQFMKMALTKQISELKEAVNKSSASIRAIIESGSHVLRTHVQCLTSMMNSKEDDMFYRFNPSSCTYVDVSGTKHLVDLEASKIAKHPLSPLLPVVMEGINRNYNRRLGLKLLCAWFLRIKVQDVFLFAADRKGVSLLAKVTSSQGADVTSKLKKKGIPPPEWEFKELRLTFKQEVEDLNGFCSMLGDMEKESLIALNQAKAKAYPIDEDELVQA